MSGEPPEGFGQDEISVTLSDNVKRVMMLEQMEAVLAWASKHVKCADGPAFKGDLWDVSTGPTRCFEGPTLYQALHTAWEKRDE